VGVDAVSALHVYVLRCDAPGCKERFEHDLPRADQTRQLAQASGWVHGLVPPDVRRGGPAKSLDYCPTHVEFGVDLAHKTLPEHAREVVAR
jgi:hypothetical protein